MAGELNLNIRVPATDRQFLVCMGICAALVRHDHHMQSYPSILKIPMPCAAILTTYLTSWLS
eukprot:m.152117 g.152117  ORF g.152117 m.152117 type:complete len:62 (-) comp17886_c0_seq2:23-208(-)